MKNHRCFTGMTVALVVTVLATLSLIACQQSQQQPAPAAAEPKAASNEKIFVHFRGPWAFVTDPKDANSVLAIAPKTTGHRDLYVQASNQSALAAGVYELSLPAHSGPAAATAGPDIAQAKIDAQSLQRALDNKSARYIIRLPKPEEYIAAGRARSRLGASYPPDATSEKAYATAVSLRYNVSSLNGFSLAGTPDNGTFNPLLLQVEAPEIRFVIEPAQDDDPRDKCNTHSREAFHHLTTLLQLTLYVDFPENPDDCHKNDPQNAHPAKADGNPVPTNQIAPLSNGDLENVQTASVADLGSLVRTANAGSIGPRLMAAFLFGRPSGDCMAPVLLLSTTTP